MCKTIGLILEKGGTGKSSSAQNIGVILSQMGYKVLCVDNDAQSHLSITFLKDKAPESLSVTLTNLIEDVIRQEPINAEMVNSAIIKTNTVDLLPSTFLMSKLDVSMNSINAREYILADILDVVKEKYDYILIDNNSSNNIFTTNTLACADSIIIPCQCQYLSMGGIPLVFNLMQSIKRRINPKLQLQGILLTMFQGQTNQSKNTVDIIRNEYKEKVFKSIIPYSTKVPDAQKLGLSVVEYDKNNPVSIAYKNFVEKELIA